MKNKMLTMAFVMAMIIGGAAAQSSGDESEIVSALSEQVDAYQDTSSATSFIIASEDFTPGNEITVRFLNDGQLASELGGEFENELVVEDPGDGTPSISVDHGGALDGVSIDQIEIVTHNASASSITDVTHYYDRNESASGQPTISQFQSSQNYVDFTYLDADGNEVTTPFSLLREILPYLIVILIFGAMMNRN